MKFAHMADCHIGGYRDPKLREAGAKAFEKAIDKCISEKVDFVLISGDLFNTSFPSLDMLKIAVLKLKELNENSISVYVIAGSHDFSPSGKTILDVLESAGLFVNVVKGSIEKNMLRLKFTEDKKTGAKITGMLGKKGMLEKTYYESLDYESLEKETGFKIFMFHTALSEFKPTELKEMPSSPVSMLPKEFDYYAGGHVHYVFQKEETEFGLIAYPGPLFPNSFSELEKLGCGGFYIYDSNELKKLRWERIQVYPIHSIFIDAENRTVEDVEKELIDEIKTKEFIDSIITIRIKGTLKSGKPSEIRFRDIFQNFYDKGAYFVMKNISKLSSTEFEDIKIETASVKETEDRLIDESIGKIKTGLSKENIPESEKKLIIKLMNTFSSEKDEGEKVYEFEEKIKSEIDKIIEEQNKK